MIDKVAKLVTPTPVDQNKLDKIASNVASRLERVYLGAIPLPEIKLGGSYARGTWLKGSFDIDFFIMYPYDYAREKLETESIQYLENALRGYKTTLRFAEHPYVEGFVDGVRVNLVPCYRVALGEWKSAADRSPYHTDYVISKMDERLKLEARLFKRFVKAAKVYGAEVRVQGFSGYVCEVLVMKYGSFKDVVSAIAKLGTSEIISIEPYDEDLATSFKSSVVILDPVDTTRNLGAAISARNVAKLVLQCRRFLKKPSVSFFYEKRAMKRPEMELLCRTLVVTFRTNWRSPDILWGQLRKSAAGISNKLEMSGFKVLRFSVASDEISTSALLFLVHETVIGSIQVRKGPEYFRGDDVNSYFAKNKRKALLTWIGEEGRMESVFYRKMGEVSDVLRNILLKDLDSSGVSEEIKKEIASGVRIRYASLLKKKDWVASAVNSLLVEE